MSDFNEDLLKFKIKKYFPGKSLSNFCIHAQAFMNFSSSYGTAESVAII